MKKMIAAAVTLTALLSVAGGAFAQDTTTQSSTTTTTSQTTPAQAAQAADITKKIASTNTLSNDVYRARWAFYNLDETSVKRYKAKGFTDSEIKSMANIAMRTGLDLDYIVRQVREVGHPISFVAAWLGVPTTSLNEDIPGYGLGPSMMMPTTPMSSGTAMTTGTSTSGSSSMAMGTVVDVIMSDPQFSTLSAAIKAAGLADTLKGTGPFTIFAPTNDAFAKLPAGALEDLLKPENKDKLVSILTYHVVPGKLKSADVAAMSNPSTATSISGKTLNVKTTSPMMVGNANITRADIDASNGEIHAIDSVLMPDATDSSSAPAAPATPSN